VLSNESGRYVIPLLPPGLYELVVEAPGFKRAVRSGTELHMSQEGRVDVCLELGQVGQAVGVRAEAA
jgi:Carboxypeptidase regulatory-like domain